MSLTFKILILLLILIVGWLFISPYVAQRLIINKPLENADAILVLSGSSVYIERTRKAAELYKKGVTQKILLTDDGVYAGWSVIEERNPKFVELAQKELIAQGVLGEDIEVLESPVTGTIYEARVLQKAIKENSWKSILVVTSAYHTKRSLWTIREVVKNENVKIGIISPPTGQQTPPITTWWLSISGWSMVGGEYLKSLYYWIYY